MPIFYIIIILIQLVFFGYSQRIKDGKIIEIFGLTITSLLLSFRTNVGADLATYRQHYEIIKSGYTPLVEFPELGYRLLEHSLARLGVSFYIFLFLISFLNLYTYYSFIKFHKLKYPTFALFIYLGLFDLFIYSLSAMRQSIAISFVLVAILAYRKSKKKSSLVFLLIATAFHWTSLIMLPVVFVLGMKKEIKARLLILLIILVPMLYYLSMNSSFIIGKIASVNYNLNYYLNLLSDERETSLITFIMGLVTAFLWVIYKLFFVNVKTNGIKIAIKKINSLSPKIEMSYVDWFVFIFLVLHACVDLIYVSAIPRLEMYFYMLLPMFVAKELEKIHGNIRILINLVIILMIVVQLYLKIQMNSFFYGEASFIFPF
ncbi:EpsG family protein [Streptococcus suis]|uniref:EpsG family protein n=1 Tax=Streptococcus suis TaxID=1307 RepID=UPI00158206BD|nr:EpsG family protein [Streptococcus suis]